VLGLLEDSSLVNSFPSSAVVHTVVLTSLVVDGVIAEK
jgi:hypothetical protein